MLRLSFVVTFALVLACGAPQSTEETPETAGISQADAERIGTTTGSDNGYDMSVYQLQSSRRQADGSWWVDFEHAPPTPPGGHFSVEVSAEGEPRIMHGE